MSGAVEIIAAYPERSTSSDVGRGGGVSGGWFLGVVRIGVPLLLLGVLYRQLGSGAFRPALDVLAPVPLAAALLLGGVAIAAQAARWRIVMRGLGLPIGRREALVECYRSSALNTVLPGGVAGDALRAWRQRTAAPRGWRPAAVSVAAERITGLCALLAAVAVVLLLEDEPAYAVPAAALAAVAWWITRRPLGRLDRRDRWAVWGVTVLALAALVALTVVAGTTLGTQGGASALATVGLVLLAGMSVPLSIGGWGPREAAGALAAVLVGAPAATGVAVAAGYGLLATASVLPGFVALVIAPGAAARTR